MRNIWNIWYEHIFWICHQNNMLFYYILLIMSCPFIVVGCVYVSVSYLQSSESNPMCRRLQFKDLLISEVHRLTKYPLLIDSMCNHVTCMCLMYNYMFLFINYGVTLFSAWHNTDVKILVKVSLYHSSPRSHTSPRYDDMTISKSYQLLTFPSILST